MSFEPLSVPGGIPSEIAVYPQQSFSHTFTSEYDTGKIKKQVVHKEVTAPVKEGDEVGSLVYFYDGKELGSVPLLARQESSKASYADYFILAVKKIFKS